MQNRFFGCIGTRDDQPITVHSHIRSRKLKIYKNLLLSSLSQSLTCFMHKGLMMLSEYEHDFLGMWSYASFNVTRLVGFFFLPKILLSRFKLQKTIRSGLLVSSLFVSILYVKKIETVLPVASLVGLAASTVWASQQLYIFRITKIMSKITGDDLQSILLRFSGIFFSVYRSYDFLSYVPIAFVSSTHEQILNHSEEHCGRRFYYGKYDSLSEFTLPPRNENSSGASIVLIFLAFCGVLLSIVFIDPLHKLTSTNLGSEDYKTDISRTIRLFKRPRLQVMIPMALFAGFEKPMKSYDFKTAFVGCTESAEHSVFVYFLGCLASSQMSMSLGFLVEITSLRFALWLSTGTHIILVLLLLFQDHVSLMAYYVISAVWGLASSVWDCLLYVLYGLLSPNDEMEAYCHLGMWYSLGALVYFITTKLVSVSFRLWMAFVSLIFASFGIFSLPFIISYTPKKVVPADVENSTKNTNSNDSRNLGMNDFTRRASVSFRYTKHRTYNRADVKSISTSRIHHVSILKTRTRFDRHESSNEDDI